MEQHLAGLARPADGLPLDLVAMPDLLGLVAALRLGGWLGHGSLHDYRCGQGV
jgi:hypothetical protein